jgi:hypothetical protein
MWKEATHKQHEDKTIVQDAVGGIFSQAILVHHFSRPATESPLSLTGCGTRFHPCGKMVGTSYDIRSLQQSTPQRSLAADYSHPQAFSERDLENNFPD